MMRSQDNSRTIKCVSAACQTLKKNATMMMNMYQEPAKD